MNLYYCPAETYPQTRETPRETCENEVEQEGDLCDQHEEYDREDADFDNYLESLRKES